MRANSRKCAIVLMYLHAAGRRHADAWIEENFDRLGVESTADIRAQYL